MGQVGFGSYRISIKSKEHRTSLVEALKAGCTLIDTSANYTRGESEELIGSVLNEFPLFNPKIVTKAGYHENGHSIAPDFLKEQLDNSLQRLRRASVDVFLLHNPEYYFAADGASQEEYYRQIEKAFLHLEDEVKKGRIKSYGISSNNFILPLTHPEVTSLEKILELTSKNKFKNFSTIQFPFNLIEIGALEKFGEYGDTSLLELAQINGLTTMTNRPLNAFTNGQLVRLATYEFMTKDFDQEKAQVDFDTAMLLVEKKWQESASSDEMADHEDFVQIPLIKQFKELWKTLPAPDAVEQVYFGHFFPFIARIWGEAGLSVSESAPFYELLEHSYKFSRLNMSLKAEEFKRQALEVGLIPAGSSQPFSVDVIETYLNYGFDYVLLGMRKTEYVDQVKHLF